MARRIHSGDPMNHINFSYSPLLPRRSPIDKKQYQSGEFNVLADTEKKMFTSSGLGIHAQVNLGDMLLALCSSITTTAEMTVVIRYLIQFSQLDDPGKCIIEQALNMVKEEVIDNIESNGGADRIIETGLDACFVNENQIDDEVFENMRAVEVIRHLNSMLDLLEQCEGYEF